MNSYINIVTFLLTTLFYYLTLKPKQTYENTTDYGQYAEYVKNNYIYVAVYLLLVMLVQFGINIAVIAEKCGGNLSENVGSAGVITFIPYLLIFGSVIVILTVYPGFKSAFSDVVGYYWVAGEANKLLTELLVDPDIQKKVNSDATMSEEEKNKMMTTADTIIKICGNSSLLINQIVPSNFNGFWNILTPLKKSQYANDSSQETIDLRNKLFEVAVTRENVGEAMWYMYTGLLLTSLVQLRITSRGCANNPKTMEANYKKFLEVEQKAKEEKEKATGTTYTITT
jgi:hypothetical protein